VTDELRIERVIGAPRGVVFDAFTTRGGQEAFYGTDDPGWIVESRCDLREGGLWTVTFGPSEDHLYEHRRSSTVRGGSSSPRPSVAPTDRPSTSRSSSRSRSWTVGHA
jgi:hypothetical protein